MELKNAINETLNELKGSFRPADNDELVRAVQERADKMKKTNDNVRIFNAQAYEVHPAPKAPQKPHKALSVLLGIGGAAAALTVAFFGLKFLNDHGGLKERTDTGAGYSPAEETEAQFTMPAKEGEEFAPPTSNTADPETLPDISELYGKAVRFRDATVWLNRAEYDGETFTASFSLLYTGDNYETYSPEYVKLTVGTLIDHTAERFSIEEAPEADSCTHRCTYSVPVKLESGKSYAMGIEYLNTDGKATQPIEADRQHYKYVYKPMTEFWFGEMPDLTGLDIDDAVGTLVKMGIGYSITRSESDEVPENCVIRTVPAAGAAVDSSVIVNIQVGSGVPSVFDDYAAAGEAYGRKFIDFGVNARVHTTEFAGCEIVQASKYVEQADIHGWMKEDGSIEGIVPTAAAPADEEGSIRPELETQTVLLADTPEERLNGFKALDLNHIGECEHSSYFSDNLGLTVDVYYARTGNVTNGFGTETITSLAVFDDGDALYILSFENTYGLADVELAAKRATESAPILSDEAEAGAITPSRVGYYEGEAALAILKQYAGGDYCYPLEGSDISKLNYRTIDSWTGGDANNGYRFNIPAEQGETIFAVTGGTVIEVNVDWLPSDEHPNGVNEGIYVVIQASDGRKWSYNHLSDHYVNVGDTVKAGDSIAAAGATGWCTGSCLVISFPDSEVIDPAASESTVAESASILSDEAETGEITPSRVGYYEGEAALAILKQYAGGDYCYPLEGSDISKLSYRTPDDIAVRSMTGDYRFNTAVTEGEPVFAVTGGTVIETFTRSVPGQNEGIYITIQASDGRKWRYSHLSALCVSEGDIVAAGDSIAAAGATGWCTGPCLGISFPDSEVIDPAAENMN
ncbi:MAG: peptidoglycan DD-metalloendopeptidase family protein [Ruminiclostridium sp.]|nr:peptidoglycan DD-metalloendopeptidase family protein [Ruminiclostridium sp.]